MKVPAAARVLLAIVAASAGCKHADDGPRPFVFPAYPVNNLPPAAPLTPPGLEEQPLRPVPLGSATPRETN